VLPDPVDTQAALSIRRTITVHFAHIITDGSFCAWDWSERKPGSRSAEPKGTGRLPSRSWTKRPLPPLAMRAMSAHPIVAAVQRNARAGVAQG